MRNIFQIIAMTVNFYSFICLIRIFLTWFPKANYSTAGRILSSVCDPYLNREKEPASPLLEPCSDIWQKYGNGNPDKLYQFANELKEYFKNK